MTLSPSKTRGAFTLIEMVLAIGLTATVVYLLSMATELYMVNVEASRGRVESAQLARTLLDQIAADLANVRVAAPAAPTGSVLGGGASAGGGTPQSGGAPAGGAGGTGGGQPGGGQSGGQPGGQPGGGSPGGGQTGSQSSSAGAGASAGAAAAPTATQGVFGNADQIRIDRSAYADWERAAREIEPQEASAPRDLPVTVRYFFSDAERLSTQRLAQQGVAREFGNTAAGGLYRETIPTSALDPLAPLLPARDEVRAGARVELLAPEVTAMSITYFDGTDLLEEWDPLVSSGLPRGVEICLTIAEPRFQSRPSQDEQQRLSEGRYLESELVEYRRFVRLPLVAPSPAAQMLLPAAQQGGRAPGQGQEAQGQGQGGQGQGGQSGSAGGGGNQPQGGGQ